jgi:hypothetical protein
MKKTTKAAEVIAQFVRWMVIGVLLLLVATPVIVSTNSSV